MMSMHIVTVDLNNLEYTLEQIPSVWGVVGSGYNNWGATPDGAFTRDWSRPFDEIWIVEGITLLDGEIKFRANNDWGVNYGDNGGDGTLRQAGVDDCGTIANVDNACFNSAGGDVANPTQAAITAGSELFGMTLRDLNTSSGGQTSSMTCDGNYDGDGSCGAGAATGYAWDPTGAFDTIASSSGPVDDEKASIEFAATASTTTPTGLYTATANFVATSTF